MNSYKRIVNSWHRENHTLRRQVRKEGEREWFQGRNRPRIPWYHDIYSAVSKDGINWEVDEEPLFQHGSVPGSLLHGGKVYVYFVDSSNEFDAMSVAVSEDNGKTFDKKLVHIKTVLPWYAVDPHPVSIKNGIRLYFMGQFPGKDNENMGNIYYAESKDGINFGNPVSLDQPENLFDPDVFIVEGNTWRMFASIASGFIKFTSEDGGKSFEREDYSTDVMGKTSTYTIKKDGRFMTYYTDHRHIGLLQGSDGLNFDDEGRIVIKEATDPSVTLLPDGRLKMFFKRIKVLRIKM